MTKEEEKYLAIALWERGAGVSTIVQILSPLIESERRCRSTRHRVLAWIEREKEERKPAPTPAPSVEVYVTRRRSA